MYSCVFAVLHMTGRAAEVADLAEFHRSQSVVGGLSALKREGQPELFMERWSHTLLRQPELTANASKDVH